MGNTVDSFKTNVLIVLFFHDSQYKKLEFFFWIALIDALIWTLQRSFQVKIYNKNQF